VAGAFEHGLIRRGIPGPGFLPFFSGLALIFASLFVLIPALRIKEKLPENIPSIERGSFTKILLAAVALVAYGVVIEYAGFFLTTLFFMLFALRLKETRWRFITSLALVTAAVSYLLFVVLLELQLPKGLLGF
jgi:hypothetical protein